jgi:hypothetical protein
MCGACEDGGLVSSYEVFDSNTPSIVGRILCFSKSFHTVTDMLCSYPKYFSKPPPVLADEPVPPSLQYDEQEPEDTLPTDSLTREAKSRRQQQLESVRGRELHFNAKAWILTKLRGSKFLSSGRVIFDDSTLMWFGDNVYKKQVTVDNLLHAELIEWEADGQPWDALQLFYEDMRLNARNVWLHKCDANSKSVILAWPTTGKVAAARQSNLLYYLVSRVLTAEEPASSSLYNWKRFAKKFSGPNLSSDQGALDWTPKNAEEPSSTDERVHRKRKD